MSTIRIPHPNAKMLDPHGRKIKIKRKTEGLGYERRKLFAQVSRKYDLEYNPCHPRIRSKSERADQPDGGHIMRKYNVDMEIIITQAERVVLRFGGLGKLHRAMLDAGIVIGHRSISKWIKSGLIPARRISDIHETARLIGLSLSHELLDHRPTVFEFRADPKRILIRDIKARERVEKRAAKERERVEKRVANEEAKAEKRRRKADGTWGKTPETVISPWTGKEEVIWTPIKKKPPKKFRYKKPKRGRRRMFYKMIKEEY